MSRGVSTVLPAQFRRSADGKLSELEFEQFLAKWFRPLPIGAIGARLVTDTTYTVTDASWLALPFNTATFDTDAGKQATGYRTPVAGMWRFEFEALLTQNERAGFRMVVDGAVVQTTDYAAQRHWLTYTGLVGADVDVDVEFSDPAVGLSPSIPAGQGIFTATLVAHPIGA